MGRAQSEDQGSACADGRKDTEQGTDAPGRSINSVGARRSAMEQTDWHEQDEQRFLTDLAKRLECGRDGRRGEVTGAGRAAARARRAAPGLLQRAARRDEAEIDKDYVKMPVHEIEKKLAA